MAEAARRKAEQERQEAEAARQKAEAERKAAQEAQRKAEQEREKAEQAARQKAEAERKAAQERERAEQAARQKAEAERKAAEEARRQEELRLALEAERRALESTEVARYKELIRQRVSGSWLKPPDWPAGRSCEVRVRLVPGGEVVAANVTNSCGNAVLDRSVEAAVVRASPLPVPVDTGLFDREFRSFTFVFKDES